MSLALYMDVHVPRAITVALRLRGADVLTAQEDDRALADDAALLERATELKRVLFTQDDDLLREGTRRQRNGHPFQGVVYVHQLRLSIGLIVDDLELICEATSPDDWTGRIEYLPLK